MRPSRSFLIASAIAFGPLLLLGLAILAALTYQVWAEARDAQRYPPPGRLVDVGGHRLHVHCTGTNRGGPTVVMDSGFSPYWMRVAPLVAQHTRACTYDRAGLGWSEPATGPRTSRHVADELRTLLTNAKELGPYVLVGSGSGGYTVRLFAHRYPADVAGIVLIDTIWEERAPQTSQPEITIRTVEWAGILGIVRAKADLTRSGWSRQPPFPRDSWPLVSSLVLRTSAFRTLAKELLAAEESAGQVRAARASFPDVPLVVLTPGAPRSDPALQQWRYWSAAHAQIAQTSPRGRHIIAQETDPPFALSRPSLVARTIQEMLDR